MKVAVTGATGFIGRRLCELARERGHEVVTLGRVSGDRIWDPASGPAPLEDVEGVIHLAGDPIAKGRWTRAKRERIRESRVAGTRNLVEGIRRANPRVLVSASAVGYYGDRGDEELTEDSAPGDDFLAEVTRAWEAEAMGSGIRTVVVRTGIALGRDGGALARMVTPFKWCLGGRLGHGRQWMSWIHLDDLAGLFLFGLEKEDLSGPLHGTAPNPVTNREFTRTLGRVLGRPAILPMPRWQLRLLFGGVADVLCSGQRCLPAKGFTFRHPDLEPALRDILGA
jgi:uncharacterized protein (TIGR01777 family)